MVVVVSLGSGSTDPVFAPLKSPPNTASKWPNLTSATKLLSFSSFVGMPLAFDATNRICTGCREPASSVIMVPGVAVRRFVPTALT